MKLNEITSRWHFYCDMDGVLNDFDGECTKLFGPTWKHWNPVKFWGTLALKPEHFFLNSQPMPDASELINYLKGQAKRGNDFSILGALPRPTGALKTSEEDKRDWLLRHFQVTKANFVMGGKNKAKFATSKKDVLIDDTKRNIEAWIKAGGTGILHTSAADTIAEIEKLLTV